jgi:uncharacterized membrane protein
MRRRKGPEWVSIIVGIYAIPFIVIELCSTKPNYYFVVIMTMLVITNFMIGLYEKN